MTQLFLHYQLPDAAPVACANCDWKGKAAELDGITDAQERLYPGETVPAGQCPDCGACAYVPERPEITQEN